MMTSLFLPDMFQTDKDLYFLRLTAYHSGMWHLGTYFVAYQSYFIKKGKTRHGSSKDDVINLEAMIKRYTFSSILQTLLPIALKLRTFGSFMLLMTNNHKFVSKKVKCVCKLCNDDVIIVPDMLHRDIQLYCPSLRAYHCGIWYLVTIFVRDLPHYMKNKKITNYRLSDDDVINLQTLLKIHIH